MIITSLMILASNARPAFSGYEIEWAPRISIQEEYDDNIYLSNDGAVSDWISVLSPGLRVYINSPISTLSFGYGADFTFYGKESSNNNVGHNAFLDIYQQVWQALELKITDRFIKSDYPLEITEGISNVRGRDTYYRNTGTLQILYHFGNENLFNIGYRNLLLEYEDSSIDDTMNHNLFTQVMYWFNPSNGIGIEYAGNKGEFEISNDFVQREGKVTLSHRFSPRTELCFGYAFSNMDFVGSEGDYNIRDWSLGITHTLANDLSISVGTGYYIQRASDVQDDDTYSLYGELEKKFKRGFIKLGATKGYDENFFDPGYIGYSRCRVVEGRGSCMLVQDLSFNLSGFFRNDVFPRPGFDQEEKRWEVGGGLAYTILEWCSAGIDYIHSERDSNIDLYDFRNNRLVFRLVLER